jgi:hypothetical protein
LIHVLATEAQNTYHDAANNYISDGLYKNDISAHTKALFTAKYPGRETHPGTMLPSPTAISCGG